MVILDRQKLIYIHIHKAGGDTVEHSLAQIQQPNDVFIDATRPFTGAGLERFSRLDKHSTALDVAHALGLEMWKTYVSWTTVRHPYARMASLYGYVAAISEPELALIGFPIDGAPGEQRTWTESADYPMEDQWAFAAVRAYLATRASRTPFSDWLRDPLMITDEPARLSQFSRVSNAEADAPLVTRTVKLKSLSDQWPQLCRELGLPLIPLLNRNKTHPRWKRAVEELFRSTADVELINTIHEVDFRWFEYQMMGRDPFPTIFAQAVSDDRGQAAAVEALPLTSSGTQAPPPHPPAQIAAIVPGDQKPIKGIESKSFRFRAAPISESDMFAEILSESTRRSVLPSEWAKLCSIGSAGSPDVYVCEAFGGASASEISCLMAAIENAGKFVILVWTDDWAFKTASATGSLVFDVSAPSPRSCTYGWNAQKYGPARLRQWKPFSERRILASFVGSRRTHQCREILFDPAITARPDVIVEDVDWWGTARMSNSQVLRAAREQRFEEILSDSKFAFCPRGNGPSSKRRWEAAYCGAIPILIEDVTRPFGSNLPLLEFAVPNTRSTRENAIDLLKLTVKALSEGKRHQDRLRQCLANDFDSSRLSPDHTTVTKIVSAANRAWSPGKGFVTDVY